MIKHIDSIETFDKEISTGLKVVDFYADWCGPCRALGSELEEYNESYPEVTILKVNCDDFTELASRYMIYSIPHMVIYVDGIKRGEHTGLLSQEALERFLNSALGILLLKFESSI